jgi:hypothetical protein
LFEDLVDGVLEFVSTGLVGVDCEVVSLVLDELADFVLTGSVNTPAKLVLVDEIGLAVLVNVDVEPFPVDVELIGDIVVVAVESGGKTSEAQVLCPEQEYMYEVEPLNEVLHVFGC